MMTCKLCLIICPLNWGMAREAEIKKKNKMKKYGKQEQILENNLQLVR